MSGLADYDYRRFGIVLSRACRADGRAQVVIAAEAGVTETDLSRARGGNTVSIAKIVALCQWMKVDHLDFYVAPEAENSTACSGSNVKHGADGRDLSILTVSLPCRHFSKSGRSA
jgi:hypothetical protein